MGDQRFRSVQRFMHFRIRITNRENPWTPKWDEWLSCKVAYTTALKLGLDDSLVPPLFRLQCLNTLSSTSAAEPTLVPKGPLDPRSPPFQSPHNSGMQASLRRQVRPPIDGVRQAINQPGVAPSIPSWSVCSMYWMYRM